MPGGWQVTDQFNEMNGLDLICRAHQLVQEGYKYMFPNENLVTVSAHAIHTCCYPLAAR